MKKIFFIAIFFFVGIFILNMPHTIATPLSDRATEQFEKGPEFLNPNPKSPFTPSTRIGDDVDLSALKIQGIIYGKSVHMALISGRATREKERIGRYTVDQISVNSVTLSQGSNLYQLKLDNYVAPTKKKASDGFMIEFRNAPLKEALSLLAKAADLNLMVPEDLVGRVSLSFMEMDLLEVIRSILRVNAYEYAVESNIFRVGKPDAFTGGTDLRTQTYHLKYGMAKDMAPRIKELLSDRGSVIADERTNILTVKDRDPIVTTISSLVAQFDSRDEQVQIDARIVDATKSFSRSLGIRWGVNAAKDNVTVSGAKILGSSTDFKNPANVNLGATNPTSSIGLAIGSLAGSINIEAQLQAAESKGDIHILSKPSVMTLNNMPAKIRSGEKIYVKSTSSISVGTAGGTSASGATGGLQEIETGITLTVTPQISLDSFIKMKIDAVESQADFSRTVDGIPAVIDNTASTTVLIRDGETTVIGGLYRVRSSTQKSGVPGFQKIPVMGLLFQSKTKTKQDNELMIFITPKLIGS